MIEIIDKSECCGCHACYSACPKNAIEMIEDEKGFKVPNVKQELCINCGKCDKVCPIKNKVDAKNDLIAYAAYNKDIDTRLNSSSGGIFSLLAEYILNQDGVVFGAKFNEKFEVIHDYITKKEDISKLQGSKYVQSIIGDSYKEARKFLEEGKYVLFTGTPCQIEGLQRYLNKDYDKLYTQDVICHGVPSPSVWRKYLKYRSLMDKEVVEFVDFRRKKESSWKDFELYIKYKSHQKCYRKNHNKDAYMNAFLRDISLRDSCYKCQFKTLNFMSDIRLADFWGIDNVKPNYGDKFGTSLVIVSTKKGKELLEKIKEFLEIDCVDISDAIRYNKNCIESCRMPKKREEFFQEINELNFEKIVERDTIKPRKSNIFIRIVRKIKKYIKKK